MERCGVRISGLDVEVVPTNGLGFVNVELKTDDGCVGRSQSALPARPAAVLAILESLKRPPLIGADATQPARLYQILAGLESPDDSPASALAIGLIEIACWDLAAQHACVPLHRLLGGAVRDSIPICVSGWEPVERNNENLSESGRQIVAEGYRIVKFSPFTLSPSDIQLSRSEAIRAVRSCEVVRAALGPDVALWLDFGSLFSAADALRLAKAMMRIDPAGIIDPLCPAASRHLTALSRRVGLPLAIGNRMNQWILRRPEFVEGALGLVAADPALAGGILATRALATLAAAHGVGFALKTSGGPVAIAHAVELGLTLPDLAYIEATNAGPLHFSDASPIARVGGMFIFGITGEPSHISTRPIV